MASPASGSYLDEHHFIFKDILKAGHPQTVVRSCIQLQAMFSETEDTELSKLMKEWRKLKAIHFVLAKNKFGPLESNDEMIYSHLSDIYDETASSLPQEDDRDSSTQPAEKNAQNDAENDRGTDQQLQQCMRALTHVMKAADDHEPLSEELIVRTHIILMEGLYSEGRFVQAGEYRNEGANADGHDFISHVNIPKNIESTVKKYNERVAKEGHDMFELAGWLLMRVLQIHPFRDGNGRLARMLWCYSLLRDGLQFPIIPFAGMKKAYNKYIKCIKRDQEVRYQKGCLYQNMSILTLASVKITWDNFINEHLKPDQKDRLPVRS